MLTAAEIAAMKVADSRQRALRDDAELRQRGVLTSAHDGDDEPLGELDFESLALLAALNEWSPEATRAKAFNAAVHPRNPKGSPGGGRFRSLVDRIKDAIAEHKKSGGKGDPFEGFNREQLRKVAKARGIELKRGEDRDSIAKKLLADLGTKGEGKPKAKAVKPAKADTSATDELPSEMSPEDVKARIPARFTVNDDTETGRLQGVRGLTAAQKRAGEKALYDYMAEDGEAAPSRIREPGPNKARDAIDTVMAHSATAEPVVVWRGLSNPEALFGDLLGRNMTGESVHDPNFQSTSARRDVAEFYAHDDGVVLRIEAPAGTRAVHLGHDDDEVLLDRGSHLKVLADTGPKTRPRLVVVGIEQPPVTAAPPKAKAAAKGKKKLGDLTLSGPSPGEKAAFRAALAEREAAMREAVEGTFGGLSVEVTDTAFYPADIGVTGIIRDRFGDQVGTFRRSFRRTADGKLVASHDLLEISPEVQGSGFAREFNASLFDWYRESGVDRVEVHADIDVGGYTWATQGFDFQDAAAAAHWRDTALQRLDSILNNKPRLSVWGGEMPGDRQRIMHDFPGLTAKEFDAEMRKMDALLKRMEGGDPVSAYEISQLGRRPGQGRDDMWIGKFFMLGSDWYGVLRL